MSVLVNVGHSYSETAALLGCSKSTVQRQMNKLKLSQTHLDKEKTGRPTKLTEEIRDQLISWIEEDRRNTCSKLSSLIKEKLSVDISERTMHIRTKEMDRQIQKHKPTSLPDLERICRHVWSEISSDYLSNLVDRIPRLCKADRGGIFR
jgi:transposase